MHTKHTHRHAARSTPSTVRSRSSFSPPITLLAAIVGLGAGAGALHARTPQVAAANEPTLAGRHLKEEILRPLDVTRFAALVDDAARPLFFAKLADRGIDPAAAVDFTHGGIVMIELPVGRQRADALRAEVAALAADPDLAQAGANRGAGAGAAPAPGLWIGPVMLDEHGGPIIPLPEILVGFAEGVGPVQAAAIVAGLGVGEIVEFDYQPGNIHLVRSAHSDGFAAIESVNVLADHPLVAWAECDMVLRGYPSAVPNDPLYSNQWFHHNTGGGGAVADIDVNTQPAWDLGYGSPSVIIAILDDGIQQNHPDINQITPGFDATGQGTTGGPTHTYDNHGTAVAGLVSAIANNGVGVAGTCPSCRSISMKIAYDPDAAWGWVSQSSWVSNGIYEAQNRGARITNSSFKMGSSSAVTSAYTATSATMLHIGAAGNDSTGSLSYPASITAVRAVAAITSAGALASFSNWGSGLQFAAPGVNLYTTDRTGSAGYSSGNYTWFDGTSGASPITAGVAGLIWSKKLSHTPGQILSVLQSTAKNLGPAGYDTTFGHGIPRAYEGVVEVSFGDICPGSGNCYVSNGTPGCSNDACCMTVCPTDPYCCNVSWDSICASGATTLCAGCGSAAAGSCFSVNGSAGCQTSACCLAVCGPDPYCCNTTWDSLCVSGAWTYCTPESDTCGGAIQLTTGVPYSFNTANATTDGMAHAACLAFGDDQIHKDIWFRWTATCNAYMTASTCGTASFDTKLAVYGPGLLGASCPSTGFLGGVLLACNDDAPGCSGFTSKIVIPVTQGTTYRIRVGGFSGASGTGSIVVTCGIPHDTCANALPIADGTTNFSTIGAITDGPSISCGSLSGAMPADTWFSYTATCTGPLTVSTCNSATFDTMIGVWGQNSLTGFVCPGTLFGGILLGCNDDVAGCGGLTSSVTVNVVQGQTYRIQLGGWGGATGTGALSITCGAPCLTDLNGDGTTNGADLGILLSQWGTAGSADLDGNGIVNGADLGLMLAAWGGC
ncbi:MAG TPA: S8 family serine peptidase [Phycisphaerales bacterium]|nr:S8 family serine peptidase [Phycisphaerales bacterium]HMP36577.1 S8 family serine peptidase [Phycisphaerales bacterium]